LLTEKDADQCLYADSAYGGEKLQAVYSKKKVISKVNEKGYRTRPLTTEQKATNREKSKTRARVEHVFGFVENSMNGSFLRCIGIVRAKAKIGMMNLTYNLFRCVQLKVMVTVMG
jgi:transposase, IS5 family